MSIVENHRNSINTVRNKWRLTLSEMAKASGVSRAWICRYLSGNVNNPTSNTMQKLTDATQTLANERRQQPDWINADETPSTPDSGPTE